MKKQDEGFTLIELLIVIVILGILATVVVFAVSGIRDQGDLSACETESRALATAVEAFYADTGDYPGATDFDTLETQYFQSELKYFTSITAGGGDTYPTFGEATDIPDECDGPGDFSGGSGT